MGTIRLAHIYPVLKHMYYEMNIMNKTKHVKIYNYIRNSIYLSKSDI